MPVSRSEAEVMRSSCGFLLLTQRGHLRELREIGRDDFADAAQVIRPSDFLIQWNRQAFSRRALLAICQTPTFCQALTAFSRAR
jgi:hypothetical protein